MSHLYSKLFDIKKLFICTVCLVVVGFVLFSIANNNPIESKPTGCGPGERYSVLKGQSAEYAAKKTRKQGPNEGVCQSYGDYTLYLL